MGIRMFGLGLATVVLASCVYNGPLDLSKTYLVSGVSNLGPAPSADPVSGTILTIRGAAYGNGTNCPIYGGGFGIRRAGVTGPDSFLYGDFVAGAAGKLYFRTPVAAPFKYYAVGTYQVPSSGLPAAGQPTQFTLAPGFSLVGEASGGTAGGSLAGSNTPCFIYMNAANLPSPEPSPVFAGP
jgi:hypothetical protein